MATNLDLLCMHLHKQPNANTKLDLQSHIVDHDTVNRKIKEKLPNACKDRVGRLVIQFGV